jgi:K+-sensing histidine kinase KdpD
VGRPVAGAGLPRGRRGVTPLRQGLGLLLAVGLLPTLTALLVWARDSLSLGSVLLLYLLAVVLVSVVGGIVPGVVAAVASFLLANFFLTPPYHTFVVESRDSVIALVVFLVVAVTVSLLVDVAARRQAAAARSAAEADVLGRMAADPLPTRSPEEVLAEVAATFQLSSVSLVERHPAATPGAPTRDVVLAHVGAPATGESTVTMSAGGERWLLGEGRDLFAEDRRLLARLAQAAAVAVDARELASEAERARTLAEVDRLRSALLAAVGHDLRTPIASIKAAATTLDQPDVQLSDDDRAELLETIVDGTDRLSDLIANLLDLSRLEAGALTVDLQPVALDEVVSRALLDRHHPDVTNVVGDDLPLVRTDAGLLERVVANLVDNAVRHSAGQGSVEVGAVVRPSSVELSVVDHGPGVAERDWPRMFLPFQRLDDRGGDGVGLGLAIARGFTDAIGGSLRPEQTPGGGLTMTVTLPTGDGPP